MQSVKGASSPANEPVRVMVVDDSAVVRGLVTRMLEEDPHLQVVASVGNGQMALNALERHDVEVEKRAVEEEPHQWWPACASSGRLTPLAASAVLRSALSRSSPASLALSQRATRTG